MMASPCCSISGLTAVTGHPERAIRELLFSCCSSSLFFFSPGNQWCFCCSQNLHKHHKDNCGCFSVILGSKVFFCCMFVMYIVESDLKWCFSVAVWSEMFTALYIYSRNLEFVLCNISHLRLCYWLRQKKMGQPT